MLKFRMYFLIFGLVLVGLLMLSRLFTNKTSTAISDQPDSVRAEIKTDSTHEINESEAINAARKNMQTVYDTSLYYAEAKLDSGIWHVDYRLKNKNSDGGGQHYRISAKTGKIISAIFEQ